MTPRKPAGSLDPRCRGARRAARCACGALGFEIANGLGDRRDAGGRRRLETRDHDFVAAANAERHQRHGAARTGAASARADLELVGQALRDARDQRRGPRVDAMRVRDHHALR